MLKKKYIVALAFILIAGCKKAPVNVGPTNQYSSSTYPTTVTQLQTVLVSCYANLRDVGLFGFDLLPRMLGQSTHTLNGNPFSFTSEMAANNLTVGDGGAQETFTALYAGVKNCNVTIYAAGVLLKTNPSVDKTAVNLIIGQAYCLRGWYYMQLECFYGEAYMQAGGVNGDKLGVSLYTEVPQSLAATQVARSPVKDVWALIISDEKQAATLLKGQVWPSTDLARATEWSAKGLLGKAYVYTQDWADAKTTLIDVITNSGKSLMPYSTYRNAFNGANKFNSESLLELYIDPNPQGGYGIYSGVANSATIDGLLWPPVTFGGYNGATPYNGTNNQLQFLGYGGNFYIHDQNILRFGYTLGYNYALVPNPKYNAATGPTYYNQQLIMDPVYHQAALQARTNNTTDPRLYVNALQPRVDSVLFDGIHFALVAENPMSSTYAWSLKKYSPIDFNESANTTVVSDKWDYYLLRLADVYLLYAEASIGSGDNVTGLEYLNKVKRRAYSMPVNTPSAIDYKSLTDATPAANPVSPDPVLGHNPLYYERWAELFNEGTWWFDVCRWKLGDSEAAYYKTAIGIPSPLTFTDSKSYVWPIPLNEMNSNSQAKQNPGY
ncbi:MAG: outer membrane protein nutrient binding [Mucilaginibacter sp.]|nr:outer membrane protein nutrient binding [Mucilaginibacter sp.]